MSTKTTKRKRASAPAPTADVAPAIEAAPAPAVNAASVSADVVPAPATSLSRTIGLSSNCTVKDAGILRGELLQMLDEPGSVAIDAKSVERVDTATMQLLCAFVRDRANRNLGVTWTATPRPLLDAARLLGIASMLALPTEASP